MNIHELLRVFTESLANFRRDIGTQLREWKKNGCDNGLVIELEAVLAEADSLSRLLDSIVDGTGEDVQISELREKLVRLKEKAKVLEGQRKGKGR